MLDIKQIRESQKDIEKKLSTRGANFSLREIVSLDKKRRELLLKTEELKHKRNKESENIARKKKEGGDVKKEIIRMQKVSQDIKKIDVSIKEVELEAGKLLLNIPNIPDSSVPAGKKPEDNKVIKETKIKQFDFEPREHMDIGESLDILDMRSAVKISESRFVMLKGQGAALERALISFMLDIHISRGYQEVIPPFLVNKESMQGTGQMPKFEVELYKCRDDDLYLIPTAEVPITNIKRDEILKEKELPLNYVSYTPCFRREAGSYGKDTKGLIRNHQFNKVELVKFVKPDESENQLEVLLSDAEEVLKRLNLPYRVVILCTGDIGFSAAKTYDLEVWMPGEKRWREVSSCSNFTDFQARRMNIKYKMKDNKTELVHTLNASGLAVGRTFAAVLENFQTKQGTVVVPDALRPYLGNIEIIDR